MTTERRPTDPQTAQRLTVLAVTGALLVTGAVLANTAGGSGTVSPVLAIHTERVLEATAPADGTVPSPTPGLSAPGQTALPLDIPTVAEEPATTRGGSAPSQKNSRPARDRKATKSEKPKRDAEKPEDRDRKESDDHETIRPPVRDEDDSDAPKIKNGKSDRPEPKVAPQGE